MEDASNTSISFHLMLVLDHTSFEVFFRRRYSHNIEVFVTIIVLSKYVEILVV